MKKRVLAFATILSLFAFDAVADDLDGFISAKMLSDNRSAGQDSASVARAIQNGDTPVFLHNERVYAIDDPQKVRDFIGKNVRISGRLDGGKVTIDSVAAR